MGCRKNTGKKKSRLLWLVVALIFFLGIGGSLFAVDQYEKIRYPLAYEELIERYAAEYDLSPAFVAAVINTESSFQPTAESSAAAIGLMQIQSDTFEWAKAKINESRSLTAEDLTDPEINIQYGCAIYRLLLDEFGALSTAVAAYHAGWGSVKKWLADPQYSTDGVTLKTIPYADTKSYLDRILHDQAQYEKRYPALASA